MADAFGDKEGLLAAVAQAGSQGAADYKAAQDALAAQQRIAIQGALGTSIPLSGEQQAALSQPIDQAYAGTQTRLGQNAGAEQQFTGTLGAAGAKFNQTLRDVVLPSALAANAAKGSGGGGGGSGKKPEEPPTWEDNLSALGGSQAYQRAGLLAAAASYGDPNTPLTIRARDYATSKLGVPDYVAAQLVPDSKYLSTLSDSLGKATAGGYNLRQYKRTTRAAATATNKAGNPLYPTTDLARESAYAVAQARAKLPTLYQARREPPKSAVFKQALATIGKKRIGNTRGK